MRLGKIREDYEIREEQRGLRRINDDGKNI